MNAVTLLINCIIPMHGKVGQLAPLAFTDHWAPMIGVVGKLAAHRPQVSRRRHLPMDWAFPMIGLVPVDVWRFVVGVLGWHV